MSETYFAETVDFTVSQISESENVRLGRNPRVLFLVFKILASVCAGYSVCKFAKVRLVK